MASHSHLRGTVILVNGVERMCASELGGTPKAGLKVALFTAQGGLCAMCGQGMTLDLGFSNTCEVSHILPGCDGSKTGIVPGNVFGGCRRCNLNAEKMTTAGDLRPHLHKFVRSDLLDTVQVWLAGWRTMATSAPADAHALASDEACAGIFR